MTTTISPNFFDNSCLPLHVYHLQKPILTNTVLMLIGVSERFTAKINVYYRNLLKKILHRLQQYFKNYVIYITTFPLQTTRGLNFLLCFRWSQGLVCWGVDGGLGEGQRGGGERFCWKREEGKVEGRFGGGGGVSTHRVHGVSPSCSYNFKCLYATWQ